MFPKSRDFPLSPKGNLWEKWSGGREAKGGVWWGKPEWGLCKNGVLEHPQKSLTQGTLKNPQGPQNQLRDP